MSKPKTKKPQMTKSSMAFLRNYITKVIYLKLFSGYDFNIHLEIIINHFVAY